MGSAHHHANTLGRWRVANSIPGLYHIAVKGRFASISGLDLARVPRVPGTRRNSEHHHWHPRILRFLVLTGKRRDHSMYVPGGTLSFNFLTQALNLLHMYVGKRAARFIET